MTERPLVSLDAHGPATGAILDRAHQLLDDLWRAVPAVSNIDRAAFVTAVAEVVGNVVGHCPDTVPDARISLTVWPDLLEARVSDDGPEAALPAEWALPDSDAISGRGLPLVAALAELEYRRDGGSNVWTVSRRRSPA